MMVAGSSEILIRAKIAIIAEGMSLTYAARAALAKRGDVVLVDDYPTTNGLTLILDNTVYANAMVSCAEGPPRLDCDSAVPGGFLLFVDDSPPIPTTVLRRPSYLASGKTTLLGVMTHADRVRLSPIVGCSYHCRFCDWNAHEYSFCDADKMFDDCMSALADSALPARHVLISGGTPRPGDRGAMDAISERFIRELPVPVDIMFSPRREQPDYVDALASWGVQDVSINVELFDQALAQKTMPEKAALGLELYQRDLERAVSLLGRSGRVRSLLIVGLESAESTLAGVEFLSGLGVHPVLSPFVPAAGTPLACWPAPSTGFLGRVYYEADKIAKSHGVTVGPACAPCQHNVLAFPGDLGSLEGE